MAQRRDSEEKPAKRPRYTPTFLGKWRERAGLSQQQLADGMGLSKGQVSHLESGTRPYTQKTIEKAVECLNAKLPTLTVADVIGINPADLVSGSILLLAQKVPESQLVAAKRMLHSLADQTLGDTKTGDAAPGAPKKRAGRARRS